MKVFLESSSVKEGYVVLKGVLCPHFYRDVVVLGGESKTEFRILNPYVYRTLSPDAGGGQVLLGCGNYLFYLFLSGILENL